jgi:hypothetical protein
MDKDNWIREFRSGGASWPALLGVYSVIVGAMIWSAMSMI